MEYQKDDKHRTRFILCLKNDSKEDAYQVLNGKALYIKKTQAKRGGYLIECSNIYDNDNNRNASQKLSRSFLIDDMFSGINHTFIFVGLPAKSHYDIFLGDDKQPGMPICIIQQMLEQANKSYRINTNIYVSFIAQHRNQLWDLLSVEDLPTTINEKYGYVSNLTELRLHDMCYFMSMFRISLRKSINWPSCGIQFAIRLKILSYDEDKQCMMQSINHFVWDGSVDPILNQLGSDTTHFHKYMLPFTQQAKVHVICAMANDKQTLLQNAPILQIWSRLRNIQSICRENVRRDELQEYEMQMNQIDSSYNCLDRFLHSNLTMDHLERFFREERYESHRMLELLDEALNVHCKEVHERLAELEEYRKATGRVLKQRLIRETNVVNSQNTMCLLQETLTPYPNLSKVAVMPEINNVITKLKKNTHIRLINIRNMIRVTQLSKSVVLSVLESFRLILEQWNCIFFDEARWNILEKYAYGRYQSRFTQWLRSRLRMFKALWRHNHKQQQNQENIQFDMSPLRPPQRPVDQKLALPRGRSRVLTMTRTEQSRDLALKQKSHSNNTTLQSLEIKTPTIRLKLPKLKFV